MESINLIGADDVRTGGNAMRSAAEEMRSAASTIDFAVSNGSRQFGELVDRFESSVRFLAEIESMKAENQYRTNLGQGVAYADAEFFTVMKKYGMEFP